MPVSVCVTIVTHNSLRFISRCLETVLAQDYSPLEVIVVDNASTDGGWEALSRWDGQIRLLRNAVNTGFSAAQNQAIGLSRSDWVLTLNPDVLLEQDFVSRLVEAGETDSSVGTVCGRLRALERDLSFPARPRLDSTGLYFSPSMRHFDRGWNEPDTGQFAEREYVFGASAAAALYRRAMIADASLDDGFFDPDFFAYREDADVAWRAQLLGWRCLYTPDALGYHVRSVRPGSRREIPPLINMHSVKNRFLMRIKNTTGDLYRRHWLAATVRDAFVIGGCLFTEPASLAAFWSIGRCLGRTLAKRRQIMARKKVDDEYLAAWFAPRPPAWTGLEPALSVPTHQQP